uniref:peptidylprolyl isomerase n=1 Tax=Sus scrofa TaxID=9823 RepID=A0A4X1WDW0_PIG
MVEGTVQLKAVVGGLEVRPLGQDCSPSRLEVMTLRPSFLPLRLLLLLLLSGAMCRAEAGFETESPVRTLQVETLVEPPEPCAEPAAFGDTLHIHYSGSLVDGRIFDTSLSRDPLVIELGQKQVIPGLEQSLLDMCVGEKRRVIIPSHLAYGKRGFPPSIPADAELHFDVELIALIRANYWQKLVKGILPLDVGDHMGSFNDVVSGWRFFVTWFGCRCGQGRGKLLRWLTMKSGLSWLSTSSLTEMPSKYCLSISRSFSLIFNNWVRLCWRLSCSSFTLLYLFQKFSMPV